MPSDSWAKTEDLTPLDAESELWEERAGMRPGGMMEDPERSLRDSGRSSGMYGYWCERNPSLEDAGDQARKKAVKLGLATVNVCLVHPGMQTVWDAASVIHEEYRAAIASAAGVFERTRYERRPPPAFEAFRSTILDGLPSLPGLSTELYYWVFE